MRSLISTVIALPLAPPSSGDYPPPVRLLDRYLLRELLVPLGYCLSGFLIFWLAFDLFSEMGQLQDQKLRGGDILQYYLARVPEFIVVVIPIALLLALLYTLTNHARHHELTAIRAAGVSVWRLCVPYLGVGLAGTFCLFALNSHMGQVTCADGISSFAIQDLMTSKFCQ